MCTKTYYYCGLCGQRIRDPSKYNGGYSFEHCGFETEPDHEEEYRQLFVPGPCHDPEGCAGGVFVGRNSGYEDRSFAALGEEGL